MMGDVDDAKAEVIKSARIFARYLQLAKVKLKKELNLTEIGILDAVELLDKAERAADPDMADVLDARDDLDTRRAINEAQGQECCLVVVGYVTGRDPFRLLGRISVDTGETNMPTPPITDSEMQPVAFAAKMAFYKILKARKKAVKKTTKKKKTTPRAENWHKGWSEVIQNMGKKQRGEPPSKTCQQCYSQYKEAESTAETFRKFCSGMCEDQYDVQLAGEDSED